MAEPTSSDVDRHGDLPLAPISTSTRPAVRKRSRTGCWTCRKRRIRCDEQHPACVKCTSTGRRCDGYPETPTPRKTRAPPMVMMIVTDFECATYDPLIGTHLQYFFHVSAPALRNHRTATFWNTTVLQACQQSPCIRNLAVAVASMERSLRGPLGVAITPDDAEVFSVHYSKALREMSMSRDIGIILIGCLMLVLLEDLKRAPFTALVHIRAGRQLLNTAPDISDRCLSDDLQAVFAAIFEHQQELAANNIRTNHISEQDLGPRSTSSSSGLIVNSTSAGFLSLEHASRRLELLRARCVTPQPHPRPLSRFHVIPGLTEELNDWLEDLNKFNLRLTDEQYQNQRGDIHALRAYHLILKIASCSTSQNEETWYDYHDQDFEGLVKKFAFMSDLGRVNLSPLVFFVACKYRHVAGRRRVIELLRYHMNGWQGAFLAEVAEKVVQTEEEGIDHPVTSGDIPESYRVRPVTIMATDSCTDQAVLCISHAPFGHHAKTTLIDMAESTNGIDPATKDMVLQSAINLVYCVESVPMLDAESMFTDDKLGLVTAWW